MAAQLKWSYLSDIIEEPFDNTASTSYTMVLENIGTNSATNVGFYLRQAAVEGDIDNPSTDGVLADWYDALTKGSASGSPAPGFQLSQNGGTNWERFSHSLGNNSQSPIVLTIGTGDDSANIAPGESVSLVFRYIPELGDPARRLYIEVELVYTEV